MNNTKFNITTHPYYAYSNIQAMKLAYNLSDKKILTIDQALLILKDELNQSTFNWITGKIAVETLELHLKKTIENKPIWTKLNNSTLSALAHPLYTEEHKTYHNLAHIESMFFWAEELNIPYCPALDKAIWAHDVIYDSIGNNEYRSATWFEYLFPNDPDLNKVKTIINSTKTHKASDDNRIILLDLADFMDEVISKENTEKIINELVTIHKSSKKQVIPNMIKFLTNMKYHISEDIENKKFKELALFKKIEIGINNRINQLTKMTHV